jgi:hypothetical protein
MFVLQTAEKPHTVMSSSLEESPEKAYLFDLLLASEIIGNQLIGTYIFEYLR